MGTERPELSPNANYKVGQLNTYVDFCFNIIIYAIPVASSDFVGFACPLIILIKISSKSLSKY
jgi:hypothetical protein